MHTRPVVAEKKWAQPGAIVLISCYDQGRPPVGVLRLAGAFSQRGFECTVVDLAVETLALERDFSAARWVAIAVPMHTAFRLGVEVARSIRRLRPDVQLTFFGLYAHLQAKHLLEMFAGAVVAGEVEGVVNHLDTFFQPREGPERSDENLERKGGSVLGFSKKTLSHLATDRCADLRNYARCEVGERVLLAGAVETTRGCLHTCLHCPVPAVYGGRFVAVPVDTVLEDISRWVERGAEHITFVDPDFLNGPGHAIRVMQAFRKRFCGLSFDFTAKVSHLLRHREKLHAFRRCGLLFVTSAFESTSGQVLDRLRKGHTPQESIEVVQAFRDAQVALRPTWIPFTPWSRLEDVVNLFRFAMEQQLVHAIDPIQYTIRLQVPSGSLLLERTEPQRWLGDLSPDRSTYTWVHSDPRMDRLQKELARCVEDSSGEETTSWRTFESMWNTVRSYVGEEPTSLSGSESGGGRVPRMTESWFC